MTFGRFFSRECVLITPDLVIWVGLNSLDILEKLGAIYSGLTLFLVPLSIGVELLNSISSRTSDQE